MREISNEIYQSYKKNEEIFIKYEPINWFIRILKK